MPQSPYTTPRPSSRKRKPKAPKPLELCDNCNQPAVTKYNLSTMMNLCPKCLNRWKATRASRAAHVAGGR